MNISQISSITKDNIRIFILRLITILKNIHIVENYTNSNNDDFNANYNMQN